MITTKLSRKGLKRLKRRGINIEKPNPGITWYWIIDTLASVLTPVMNAITKELKTKLEDFLKDFYVDCVESENPFDDFLARFLLRIFEIEIPE